MSSDKEIYASFEIRDYYLNFIVMYYDDSNEYNVLFEKHIEGKYSNNGIITNPKLLVKQIKKIIEEANQQLYLEITRVGLVLPNVNLKIFKHISTKKYKTTKKISKEDIQEFLADYKEIYIPEEQIIASIQPYMYIVNRLEKTKQLLPPIGANSDFLTIKTLIYTIDKAIYKSHLNVLKLAKLKVLSITTKSYSLAFSTGIKNLKNTFVIVDWNDLSVDINVYVKKRLAIFKSFKSWGINNFISHLKKEFDIEYESIKKYVYNVLNSEILNTTNNFTVYNKINANKKNIKISMQDLLNDFQNYCDQIFEKIDEFITKNITSITKNSDINTTILFTGDIIKISDFEKYFNNKNISNYKLYKSNFIGVQEAWSIPIIGNIFHHRFVNKLQNNFLTSI